MGISAQAARWLRRGGFLAAAALTGAAPATLLAAKEPLQLDGTEWARQGEATLSIKRVGKISQPTTTRLTFTAPNIATIHDDGRGLTFDGTYVRKGRAGQKIVTTLEPEAITTAEGYLEPLIELFLAINGETADITLEITSYYSRSVVVGDGETLKGFLGYKFLAHREGAKPFKGTLKVKAEGSQTTPP